MKDCALSLCAKLSKPEPNLLKKVCIPVITAWSRPVKSFAQALKEARVIPPIAIPIGAIAAADKPDMLAAIFSTIVDAIDLNTMSLANLKANNADKSTIIFGSFFAASIAAVIAPLITSHTIWPILLRALP